MLCVSPYSTSSLMTDSMGYREAGGIGFETRMKVSRDFERRQEFRIEVQ